MDGAAAGRSGPHAARAVRVARRRPALPRQPGAREAAPDISQAAGQTASAGRGRPRPRVSRSRSEHHHRDLARAGRRDYRRRTVRNARRPRSVAGRRTGVSQGAAQQGRSRQGAAAAHRFAGALQTRRQAHRVQHDAGLCRRPCGCCRCRAQRRHPGPVTVDRAARAEVADAKAQPAVNDVVLAEIGGKNSVQRVLNVGFVPALAAVDPFADVGARAAVAHTWQISLEGAGRQRACLRRAQRLRRHDRGPDASWRRAPRIAAGRRDRRALERRRRRRASRRRPETAAPRRSRDPGTADHLDPIEGVERRARELARRQRRRNRSAHIAAGDRPRLQRRLGQPAIHAAVDADRSRHVPAGRGHAVGWRAVVAAGGRSRRAARRRAGVHARSRSGSWSRSATAFAA